jgi:hypothetical protein
LSGRQTGIKKGENAAAEEKKDYAKVEGTERDRLSYLTSQADHNEIKIDMPPATGETTNRNQQQTN